MEGYGPSTYGDAFADVYDDWYTELPPPTVTAEFVARRSTGLVVELGSGTGRLAGALGAAGLPVVGLDASTAMLRRSRHTHPHLPVVAADMAEQPFRRGVAGCVLVAFNTLFNLPTGAGQRAALHQAADLLAEGGAVVVEAFVPADLGDAGGGHVDVVRSTDEVVVLSVSRTDPGRQTVWGHHVELRDGEPVRLRPWHVRFTDPDGVDALATSAGLELEARYGDWTGAPFDDRSTSHVSVYRHARRHR
jgi:SAM-dependent methyltransferase